MAQDDHWFHVANFSGMGGFLSERGVAPAEVLRRCGVSPHVFLDRDYLIPRTGALRIMNEIGRMTGDRTAALQIAARQRLEDYGAFGHEVLAAPTVREALGIVHRGIGLMQSGSSVHLHTSARHVQVALASTGTLLADPRDYYETAVLWVRRIVTIAGETGGVEVRMPGPRPRRTATYERLLGPRLTFGADEFSVVIDRDLLDARIGPRRSVSPGAHAPMVGADPIEGARTIRDAIRASLPHRAATIDGVALQMGMSRRTLQRWLERWGVPFEAMVDEARRERALGLMAAGNHALVEIAFLVGYSDQAHFGRAFRRWTGETPRGFLLRRANGADGAGTLAP